MFDIHCEIILTVKLINLFITSHDHYFFLFFPFFFCGEDTLDLSLLGDFKYTIHYC